MSSDQPYNQLGQILATGGEQSVALAMDRGWGSTRIVSMLARRYGPIASDTYESVRGIADSILRAGEGAFDVDITGRIPAERIPVVPELFGDDNEGQRTRYTAEVEFEGATNSVLVYGSFANIPTADELEEDAANRAGAIADQYRGKFGLADDAEIIPANIRIVLLERKF